MEKMDPEKVKDLPQNNPSPRRNPIQVSCIFGSNHACDKITRRYQSGILLYLNKAPI